MVYAPEDPVQGSHIWYVLLEINNIHPHKSAALFVLVIGELFLMYMDVVFGTDVGGVIMHPPPATYLVVLLEKCC